MFAYFLKEKKPPEAPGPLSIQPVPPSGPPPAVGKRPVPNIKPQARCGMGNWKQTVEVKTMKSCYMS